METFEELFKRYQEIALGLWRYTGTERGNKMRIEMETIKEQILQLHQDVLFKLAWWDAHTKDYYTPED